MGEWKIMINPITHRHIINFKNKYHFTDEMLGNAMGFTIESVRQSVWRLKHNRGRVITFSNRFRELLNKENIKLNDLED